MNIVDAYRRTGSYRAAAAICRVNHKTVRRVVERSRRGRFERQPALRRPRNTDVVLALIAETGASTDGRISAKRLLPRSAGGRLRRLWPATSAVRWPRRKAGWRRQRRTYPTLGAGARRAPGHRLGHRGRAAGVLRGARLEPLPVRALRRATRRARHHAAPARRVLRGDRRRARGRARRPDGLSQGPAWSPTSWCRTPDYVRFATHYGFRPDFCEAGGPRVQGRRRGPRPLRQEDLVVAAGRWADDGRGERGAPGLVRRGQRARPHRDRRRPGRAAGRRAGRCSARCRRCARRCGAASAAQGRPPGDRPLRLGPLLGARRAGRPAGRGRWPSTARSSSATRRRGRRRHPLVAPGEVVARRRALRRSAVAGRSGRCGPARRRSTPSWRSARSPRRFLRAAAAAGTTRLGSELAADRRPRGGLGRDAAAGRARAGARLPALRRRRRALHPGRRRRAAHASPSPARTLALDLPAVPVRPLDGLRASRRCG